MKLYEMIDDMDKQREIELRGGILGEKITVKYEDGELYISERFIPVGELYKLNAFISTLLKEY